MDRVLFSGLDLQLFLTICLFVTSWAIANRLGRRDFFTWWTWGWLSLGVLILGFRIAPALGLGGRAEGLVHVALTPLGLLQVTFFYLGARALREGGPVPRRLVSRLVGGTVAVGVVLGAVAMLFWADPVAWPVRVGLRQLGLAVVFPFCALAILSREERRPYPLSTVIMALGFLAWGLNQLGYAAGSGAGILSALTDWTLAEALQTYQSTSFSISVDILSEAVIGVGAGLFVLDDAVAARRGLRETRSRFRHVLDNAGDAILLYDLDGHLLEVNRAACESLGYSRDELLDLRIDEVELELEQPERRTEYLRALEEGKGVTLEGRHRRAGGATFPVEVRLALMDLEEVETRAVLAVARDVTERKRHERELERAKEKAEAADRAKSEFLATMSHEIRTPMNAIIGMAELLQETDLSPEQRDYVQVFRTAGDTLLGIINEVLDLSRIEAGRLELTRDGFDPRSLAEEVVQVFAVSAHRKDIELAVRVSPDTPRWLVGDASRLRQVLVNLVGNAVKFTDEGEVVLQVRPGSVDDGEPPRRELLFSVRDTGIGIAEDQLDSVFERFTQADSSSTRRHGGTGLGLTICKAIVELMGGTIGVRSEKGEGSTFHFNAWFEVAPRPEEADETGAPVELEGLKALLVDDNATNRLILHEMLTAWGLQTGQARNGSTALAELREARRSGAPYHVLLLDGHMPEMDGFEVAEAIRHDPGLAGTTVMMLTSGDSNPTEIERARELGVSRYMVKPIRRARLLDALSGAVDEAGHEAGEEETEAEDVPGGSRGLEILVVEDADDNRMLIERYLRARDHRVEMTENGAEAVDRYVARAGEFDVVLMDVQMPVMDGYEATRRIRAWERENDAERTPILALTAHALASEKEKSREAGCDEHLTKPIKKKALLATLDRYGEGGMTA